jgi:hypothetical protein
MPNQAFGATIASKNGFKAEGMLANFNSLLKALSISGN